MSTFGEIALEKDKTNDTWTSKDTSSTILTILAMALVLCTILFFQVTYNVTETSSVAPTITYEPDGARELGDDYTRVEGVAGKDESIYETTGSLFQRIFTPNKVIKNLVQTDRIQEPENIVIVQGTKKYQYMYCSNQTYYHYTDEQFADPNTGYTSRSPDQCASSGNGVKLSLSDKPPNARPTCVDVTSYDYNWNNDVLCTNPDGTRYYTSYAGAGWYR